MRGQRLFAAEGFTGAVRHGARDEGEPSRCSGLGRSAGRRRRLSRPAGGGAKLPMGSPRSLPVPTSLRQAPPLRGVPGPERGTPRRCSISYRRQRDGWARGGGVPRGADRLGTAWLRLTVRFLSVQPLLEEGETWKECKLVQQVSAEVRRAVRPLPASPRFAPLRSSWSPPRVFLLISSRAAFASKASSLSSQA